MSSEFLTKMVRMILDTEKELVEAFTVPSRCHVMLTLGEKLHDISNGVDADGSWPRLSRSS